MMKSARKLTTILFITFLAVLSTAASATGWGQHKKPTILDSLVNTDGAQALVAAVQIVDENGSLGFSLADLLGDKNSGVILLAPSNNAFEQLLGLDEGYLNGLSIGQIKEALLAPGTLPPGVGVPEVQAILLKHASLPNRANKSTVSQNALLKKGEIEVADGSVFSVSIGTAGVKVNYEATITKPDNYFRNGVIHFIDQVIVDDLV